ncbi:MAG: hypothetical protein V2J26_03580 [Pacificimonas sp.]|jgi:hypothetical protein|nr:hypothetical protein [Pacificimonas sp.]
MDGLLADMARADLMAGEPFDRRAFHDEFLAAGRLPIALIRDEMTGDPAAVSPFWTTPPTPGTGE